ncbi:hypothetical protein J4727_17675 [Providencia rettgeri]|uniref:Uncharacterized protein n=1 Tax=Providencia rettgeri TaxID=587 RepID=A0A939NBF0_PRORE|nr:hypothetical protein [Providencia rettgeri]
MKRRNTIATYISIRRHQEANKPELPKSATLAERIMWDANKDDAEWRHEIIAHVPDFLAIYFATKYAKIFKNQVVVVPMNFYAKPLRMYCHDLNV